MSYKDHPFVLDALAVQGYLKGSDNDPLEKRTLDNDKLAEAIMDQFTVVVDNDPDEISNLALSQDQLVENLFPTFYESVRVTSVDRSNPDLLPEVNEKDAAKAEMQNLVWKEAAVTSTGRVQGLFGSSNPALVLVETSVERKTLLPSGRTSPKPVKIKVRFPTRNEDIVNEYVHIRGTRFKGIADATSADVRMAIKRIPGAEDRFKETYGLQVDNAIEAVKSVAITRFIREELTNGQPMPPDPVPANGNNTKVKVEKAEKAGA